MFVRNLLQAGDYAMLVPIGIPITLQYSEKGTLQKVYQNHDKASRIELPNSVLEHLIKCKQVPSKISIKGGTTWVEGVLYSEESFHMPGELPDCIIDVALSTYDVDPSKFTFYAGTVESLAQRFKGPVAIRQWLSIEQFKVLNGYLISAGLDEDMFEAMVSRDYLFGFPKVASYIVFRGDNILYLSTGLSQEIVKDTKRIVKEDGEICVKVTIQDDTESIVPYATVVNLNITKDTLIMYDNEHDVIYSESENEVEDVVGNAITCSVCGRKLIVPKNTKTIFKCIDPQCNSVLYPRIAQLLRCLDLPMMSYDEYIEIANKIGNIFSIPDLFDLDEYKDVEITASLHDVLRAVIPKTVLPGNTQIAQLCDACMNSPETFIYYAQNVDKMRLELGLDIHTFNRLFKWLLNPENVSDVVELLKLKNISYISSKSKFEGAPIFRDKTIMLTGTFTHGSLADVSAILESYSAKVTSSFDADTNCLIVGDIQENINGSLIHKAQQAGVPIMKESDFFWEYEIDADLSANLK